MQQLIQIAPERADSFAPRPYGLRDTIVELDVDDVGVVKHHTLVGTRCIVGCCPTNAQESEKGIEYSHLVGDWREVQRGGE